MRVSKQLLLETDDLKIAWLLFIELYTIDTWLDQKPWNDLDIIELWHIMPHIQKYLTMFIILGTTRQKCAFGIYIRKLILGAKSFFPVSLRIWIKINVTLENVITQCVKSTSVSVTTQTDRRKKSGDYEREKRTRESENWGDVIKGQWRNSDRTRGRVLNEMI